MTTVHPGPSPLASSSFPSASTSAPTSPSPVSGTHTTPPTPSSAFPAALARLREHALERNASTSSSRSTTTTSSTTSSLIAAPIRPPPIETSTAATNAIQLPPPSRPGSVAPSMSVAGSQAGSDTGYSTGTGPGAGEGYGAYYSPQAAYGGRGFQRNGPRAGPSTLLLGGGGGGAGGGGGRQATLPPPAIVTHDTPTPARASSVPLPEYYSYNALPSGGGGGLSPTIPRAPYGRFYEDDGSPQLGVGASAGATPRGKVRAGSSGGAGQAGARDRSRERERRQSGTSAKSSSSQRPKETPGDYIFGEELGRGSYSTVVQAVRAATTSPTSPHPRPRAPKQYAIKIINQAHLVQEKKTKYAIIERDALIRLNAPRSGPGSGMGDSPTLSTSVLRPAGTVPSSSAVGPGSRYEREHRRGMSGSSASTLAPKPSQPSSRRESVNERSTALSESSSSTTTYTVAPLSPSLSSSFASSSLAGRRPSRSADPPESVPERSDEGHGEVIVRSRPPSPVREESSREEGTPKMDSIPMMQASTAATRTPQQRLSDESARAGDAAGASGARSRRASKAPSERSVRSTRSGKGSVHPGIIRLYSTFNDSTSLYFVLDLASNGELLTHLRKFGSLDIDSARYYAALVLDTLDFMHERNVVHRDLKPENILLDSEMRVKITDFGSAKLFNKEGKDPKEDQASKRSFVGSADFVSPEVLRNESASFASDVWAFGCIVYQLLVGKPPFRGATDYLTFQKILKREMEYPEGFDPDAKALIDVILNLDADSRPSPPDLKVHPFFTPIDWQTIWVVPAVPMTTGLTRPVATLASVQPDSDMWAVFEDDVSDGGFEYDDFDSPRAGFKAESPRRLTPVYDGQVAAEAVRAVGPSAGHGMPAHSAAPGSLNPSMAYGPGGGVSGGAGGAGMHGRKPRGFSRGSARTSSSSSGNRTALSGLLESMGIGPAVSGRTSRTSVKSDEKSASQSQSQSPSMSMTLPPIRRNGSWATDGSAREQPKDGKEGGNSRWNPLLLANERITFTSPITLRTSSLPPFLSLGIGTAKRRQLVLTDFPRLFLVKEENPSAAIQGAASLAAAGQASMSVRDECVFVSRPSTASAASAASAADNWADAREANAGRVYGTAGGANRVLDVSEKGSKGFVVQTSSQSLVYFADTSDLRAEWLKAIKGAMA